MFLYFFLNVSIVHKCINYTYVYVWSIGNKVCRRFDKYCDLMMRLGNLLLKSNINTMIYTIIMI